MRRGPTCAYGRNSPKRGGVKWTTLRRLYENPENLVHKFSAGGGGGSLNIPPFFQGSKMLKNSPKMAKNGHFFAIFEH